MCIRCGDVFNCQYSGQQRNFLRGTFDNRQMSPLTPTQQRKFDMSKKYIAIQKSCGNLLSSSDSLAELQDMVSKIAKKTVDEFAIFEKIVEIESSNKVEIKSTKAS